MKKIGLFTAGVLLASPAYAIDLEQMEIYGYGTINYYQTYDYLQNYQSKPKSRSKIDLERFVLSPRFIISDNVKIVSEIEFEHGGTGTTMEYDTLDEFGEFETEVEKGGEIVIEEIYVAIDYLPTLNFKIGHIIVPVGMNSQRHLPNLYYSAVRNRSETRIIPNTWHESGVMIEGSYNDNLHYQAMVMNGLNSEFFNSAHWIQAGHQKRFEHVNADNLAGALRVDYGDILGSHIGASFYMGNSGENRNKRPLNEDATVTIADIHGVYEYKGLNLRALALYGKLSDSEAVTTANRGLPNALEAKRSPVASEALAWFVEAGYNISPLIKQVDKDLIIFSKYDFSDSMYATEGVIQDLDQYEQSTVTAGLNYMYSPNLTFKAEYATTSFGSGSGLDDMEEIIFGMGYQF